MSKLNEISLSKWINASPTERISRFFPNERARMDYLAQIMNYSDIEIRDNLRSFLIQSQAYPLDGVYARHIVDRIRNKAIQPNELTELQRRFLNFYISKGSKPAWEGLSWILDMLPYRPQEAIDIIDNYIVTHFAGGLYDALIYSMYDAISVIRARYITRANDNSGAQRALQSLNPRDFEHLIETLYHRMGYRTILTKQTGDGGRDIIASKTKPGNKETIFVECKRHKNKIDVGIVRKLLGIITPNRATRGAIVTTFTFTGPAIKEANEDHRIELIDVKKLIQLLNQFLGTTWPLCADLAIADSKKRCASLTKGKEPRKR